MRENILIAALVSGVSVLTFGVASADVVLSGQLIGDIENIHASGVNDNGNGDLKFRPRTRFNDESSYVRITGLEDLGGGVQAGFQIESGFDVSGNNASGDNYSTVNTGNTSRGFGFRNTGIYFQGGFGKILFGRWKVFVDTIHFIEPDRDEPDLKSVRKSLPNKTSLLSIFNLPTGSKSGFDLFLGDLENNVLSYFTPKFYGAQLQLSYAPTNESSALGAAQPDVTFNGRTYTGTLVYKSDSIPLTVMVAGFQNRGNAVGTLQGLTTDYNLIAWRFGAVWKLRLTDAMSLHIAAIYQPSSVTGTPSGATNSTTYKRKSWGIPLALRIGPNTIYATYGRNNNMTTNVNGGDTTLPDTSANFYMLGYNYDLSKRTALGLYYVRISNNSKAKYDFYTNSVSIYGVQEGTVPIAVGLSFRHLF